MTDPSFTCATCGQEHSGFPRDFAYGLPDDVYVLSYVDRYRRSRSNADLATLDDARYFLRAVLSIPFVSSDEEFVWGLWVEVGKEQHDLYVAGFHDDLSDNPPFEARLANAVPAYDESLQLAVEVQFSSGNSRPSLRFPAGASHAFAREQWEGITRERHHQILEQVGFFDRQ